MVLVNEALKKKGCLYVNKKKIYRLMKQTSPSKAGIKAIKIAYRKSGDVNSNTRWCSDAFSIQCLNGGGGKCMSPSQSTLAIEKRYIALTVGIDDKQSEI